MHLKKKLMIIWYLLDLSVKPQQATPASKKMPISSGPIKPRAMMAPIVQPKSPVDVPLKPGKEDQDIQVHITVEFLNFRTTENFAVIILKLEKRGFTI